MGTIISIIGLAATVLVSRYYFNRTVNKHLSAFVTLSNRVFAGVEPAVRNNLEIKYNREDVKELQQIDLVIANDGNRAIRDCIEPLTLRISKPARILDTSVLHRSPSDLGVELSHSQDGSGVPSVCCSFPLLNVGEFFYVKLLLDQHVNSSDISCHILCDDLPRRFETKHLPSSATTKSQRSVEWVGVGIGGSILVALAAHLTVLWNCYLAKPSIFPYPWDTFQASWGETPALFVNAIGIVIFFALGLTTLIGMGFEDFFDRNPRFPLPDKLRGRRFHFVDHERLRTDLGNDGSGNRPPPDTGTVA